MNGYWWIYGAIFVVVLIALVIQARNFFLRKIVREAVNLAANGDYAGALSIVTATLNRMPPTARCTNEVARQKFHLLAIYSQIVRKTTGDAYQELELLNECVVLLKYLPPVPTGPDQFVNFPYQIFMNHGNAAVRAGDHKLATESYVSALNAAREPAIQCKCLAYLGTALIRQNTPDKLEQARKYFDRFDEIQHTLHDKGKDISPFLVSHVLHGRAFQHLRENNLFAALSDCEQALRLDPTAIGMRTLLEILSRPDASVEDGIEFMLGENSPKPSAADSSLPLSPLPESI